MSSPVTQRDVALACGVHPSTICLALGNSPAIPPATRARIRKTALTLGYRPNAAARDLAFLRSERKDAGAPQIAWVNQEPTRDFWKAHPEALTYWEGARQRAEELGYRLVDFWLEPGMRSSRLAQILASRAIQGAVLPVFRRYEHVLPGSAWDKCATVALNDHRLGDAFDLICPDYYFNMDLAWRQLGGSSGRRVGLVLTQDWDQATNGLVRSCYLRHQEDQESAGSLPALILGRDPKTHQEQFAAWHLRHRPEGIVCGDSTVSGWIRAAAPRAEVVQLQAGTGERRGIDERGADLAAIAVDCIADKIRRFRQGASDRTQLHLLKGSWCGVGIGDRVAEAVA